MNEFDILRKLGTKFNSRNSCALGVHILIKSASTEYNPNKIYYNANNPLHECITTRFTQSFANKFCIFSRAVAGKHKLSPEETAEIGKKASYHLSAACREFCSCEFREEEIENVDETHFIIY